MKLPFGKWRGTEVRKADSSYLRYLAERNIDLDPALVDEILRELHQRHSKLLDSYGHGDCISPLPDGPLISSGSFSG